MDDFEDLDMELDDLGIELTPIHGSRKESTDSTAQGTGISLDEALHKIGEFGAFQLSVLAVIFLASGLCSPFRIMAPVYIHKAYTRFNCEADRYVGSQISDSLGTRPMRRLTPSEKDRGMQ